MLAAGRVERILCAPEWPERLAIPPEVEVRIADHRELERIVGYRLHSGVMAMGPIPAPTPIAGGLLVALDGLANAENVGTVMRCCAAFGVDGVLVGPGTTSPWIRRAVRVSVGAPLAVPVHEVDDLAAACSARNAWAAHIHGSRLDYREVDLTEPVCLVLGSEANGVSERVLAACRGTLYIPMAAGWDCLNVGSSAAVLLAEVGRQRVARGADRPRAAASREDGRTC